MFMEAPAGTKDLLNEYYSRLSEKGEWAPLLSDDFLLTGTVTKETRGREVYADNGFFKLVRGLTVKEMIVQNENAFALVNYSLASPKGKVLSLDVAEVWKAKDGKLISVAIYFDTVVFNYFMA